MRSYISERPESFSGSHAEGDSMRRARRCGKVGGAAKETADEAGDGGEMDKTSMDGYEGRCKVGAGVR